jgi:crotonobetainyl-CoA:carnitine CoA-transferase CaiB-like acyl-CoA transferase
VAIAVGSDEEWSFLKSAMGNPPELNAEKFAAMRQRLENHDELDEYIQAWTSQYTHQEVMTVLQNHGVPAGAVWNAEELLADPQLNERGFFWEIDHPEVGRRKYCGFPIRMSDVPEWPHNPAPCLGEHNAYVLKKVLGFSDEEIQKLEEARVIGTEPIG